MHTERQTTIGGAAPRTIALVTGVLFVITYITSIPPVLFLYVPVLNDPGYIVGAGADNGVLWGAFLELLLIVANIGTAVVLFPILKRQNEGLALGFVTARIVEHAAPLLDVGKVVVAARGRGERHRGRARRGSAGARRRDRAAEGEACCEQRAPGVRGRHGGECFVPGSAWQWESSSGSANGTPRRPSSATWSPASASAWSVSSPTDVNPDPNCSSVPNQM